MASRLRERPGRPPKPRHVAHRALPQAGRSNEKAAVSVRRLWYALWAASFVRYEAYARNDMFAHPQKGEETPCVLHGKKSSPSPLPQLCCLCRLRPRALKPQPPTPAIRWIRHAKPSSVVSKAPVKMCSNTSCRCSGKRMQQLPAKRPPASMRAKRPTE